MTERRDRFTAAMDKQKAVERAENNCTIADSMGPSIKGNLDWHGCDSVCHPAAADGENGTQDEV